MTLDRDLIALNNVICHHGVKGQEWYKNKADRFQAHAKYARGRHGAYAHGRQSKSDIPSSDSTSNKTKRDVVLSFKGSHKYDWGFANKKELDKAWRDLMDGKAGARKIAPEFFEQTLSGKVRALSRAASATIRSAIDRCRALKSPVDKETGFRVKREQTSMAEDSKAVNPAFENLRVGTKNNCMLCSAAYEMRRRGYDVRAQGMGESGASDELVNEFFPGAKTESAAFRKGASTAAIRKEFEKTVLEQGEGARGQFTVMWHNWDASHSVSYEVKNGKAYLVDAQEGFAVPITDKNANYAFENVSQFWLRRLDNVPFDPKLIKEAVK